MFKCIMFRFCTASATLELRPHHRCCHGVIFVINNMTSDADVNFVSSSDAICVQHIVQNHIKVYPYFVKRSMKNMNYYEAKSSSRKFCQHCAEYLMKWTYFIHRRKYCDRIGGKWEVSTKNYHLDTERYHETNPESKPRQGETLPGTSQTKSKKTHTHGKEMCQMSQFLVFNISVTLHSYS